MNDAFADGAVDEPAELSCLEFPSRASKFQLRRAASYLPTGATSRLMLLLSRKEKEELPLNMGGDVAPSLFIAVDGLKGCPQQFGHPFLGLAEGLTHAGEFITVH